MLLHLLVLKVGGWMDQMLLLVSCCSFLQVTTNGSWRHFPECLTSDSVSYFHTPIYILSYLGGYGWDPLETLNLKA